MLTKLLEINHPLVSTANHPPLKFSIMFSAFIVQKSEVLKFFENPAITPSLHMHSDIDHIIKKGNYLELYIEQLLTFNLAYSVENANNYINPIVIEHTLG
jgi:hypothetical protein